ncbi:MAG: trans-sulfuration enzyme family protein [Chloroflexota bacterium]
MHPETIAVRGGIVHHPGDEVSPPIHLSTTFVQPDVVPPGQFSYGRGGSPGFLPLERALAEVEGGTDAVAFNAGAAAFVALAEETKPGTAVVFPEDAYYGFRVWMENNAARFGWDLRLVRQQDLGAVERALDGASFLWAETPTNPTLGVADLAAIGQLCAARGVPWACDNTFASPALQRPLEFGAAASMHSVTKYIAGHSDVIMGAVIVRDAELAGRLRGRRSSNGTQPDGFGCWLARRGLQTLPLRVRQQAATALDLAGRLQRHPKVRMVHYPGLPDAPGHEVAARQMRGGFGGMLSIVLAGGEAAAIALPGRCRVWVPATSLGGVESLIERRARWAGEVADPALLRLSCGIEHVDDLWDDLEQALG